MSSGGPVELKAGAQQSGKVEVGKRQSKPDCKPKEATCMNEKELASAEFDDLLVNEIEGD
jgi:hypothetical protein